MGLVPKLSTSCFCCTLKTGSFVTAVFLLVGSCVQVGYYAFLVTHMYPQKMCVRYETVIIKEPPPARDSHNDGDYNQWGGSYRDIMRLWWGDDQYPSPEESGGLYGMDAANTTDGGSANSSYAVRHAGNTTGGVTANSSYAANTTGGETTNSSYAANTTDGEPTYSSYAANTTGGETTNSSYAVNTTYGGGGMPPPYWPWQRRRWGLGGLWGFPILSFPRERLGTRSYLRPCIRDYKPFDADNDVLDFDLRGQFDKSILYFNIGIWVTMMAATPLLMAGVYKESAVMVTAWLVAECLLLMVATASTLATVALMFHVVLVQIPIVTLINMAIHLGLDIYYLMVVANFRRQLTTKEEDEEDHDDKQVEQVIV